MSGQVLLGILLGLLISISSFVARFLTLSGAIATFCLAVIVFGIGGWQWTIPIVMFFLLSSVLSKWGRVRKKEFDQLFEKSSTRDWGQVLANGGVAGALVIISALFPIYDFYPLYLGVLAAVTADTWGTEIGVLSKGRTVSILTLKDIDAGRSGGISEAGTLGGAVGAALVALSAYPWYTELRTTFVVVVAGMAGSLADSFLGATLQGQFRCNICGKITERRLHCGEATARISGVRWVSNDVVNGICGMVGALVVWGLMMLL